MSFLLIILLNNVRLGPDVSVNVSLRMRKSNTLAGGRYLENIPRGLNLCISIMATVSDSSAAMEITSGHKETGKEPLDAKARDQPWKERECVRICTVLDKFS